MNQIQDLIRQINNAERLGLSIAEVTEAQKVLKIEFAKLAFDVDQTLRFEPVDERRVVITQADLQDEFIDLEPLKLWDED